MDQEDRAPVKLQHNYLLNPITALTFYHGISGRVFILAGEDAWLKVYDVDSNQLLGQLRIFHSQSIHGIHVPELITEGNCSHLLIWGGHSVTVLSRQSLDDLAAGHSPDPPEELRAPDWIYDGIIFSSGNIIGALVTAHNEIVPILADSDGDTFSFGGLTSPSRPILYSANICLLAPDTLLVAGGTVFGEIIVWKYHVDPAWPCQWEVLFVFTGHEGSIFGVDISPELQLAPDIKVRLLASCSDDRTIRVWDITDRSLTTTDGEISYSKALGDARETGFGGNSEAKVENGKDSSRCIAVEMGHVSRIWHAKFTGRTDYYLSQASPVEIYSFGEDSSRQRWELSLDLSRSASPTEPIRENVSQDSQLFSGSKRIGTLRNCGASTCHAGKNIWATAISTSGDASLVASGGADGRIMVSGSREVPILHSGERPTQGSEDLQTTYCDIDISMIFQDFTKSVRTSLGIHGDTSPDYPAAETVKDGFHRYAFLSDNTVLVTSALGRLFIGTITQNLAWKEVLVPKAIRVDLTSFHVVKSPLPGVAIIGSGSGKVYLFSESLGITELAQFSAKVTDIIPVGRDSQQPSRGGLSETNTIIVTVLGLHHATLLAFDATTGASTTDRRTLEFDPDYSHYVLTSASFCGDNLLLGSRVGVLTLYQVSADRFTVLDSRKDCRSKDAVTSILPLPGSSTSFLATCRDGRYRIYTISKSGDRSTLILQHEISSHLGVIEGASFVKSLSGNLELILYGFRSQSFALWNETARQELAAVECGGAHRPFSYISSLADPGQLRLVFTKVAQMRFYSQARPALRVLKEGAHGREIRAIATNSGRYVATAAEDTTVRIWQYRDDPDPRSRGFGCLAVLEKHSAGIQSLHWHGDDYLLSSAGNEEFYIWRVARLDSDYQALAVVCEAVYPDRSADGDLRIMNLDVQSWGNHNQKKEMLISLALSNSTFRTYQYSQDKGFRLLSKGHYTGACLTQIRQLRTGDNSEMHVLTASTDGHLAIWSSRVRTNDAEEQRYNDFSLATVTRLHQSTIKSLDLHLEQSGSDTRWLVITGGDDNALGFLDLVWAGDKQEFIIGGKSRVQSAHAAAVTGLCVLQRGQKDVGWVEVATVSNDQRVKVWRVKRGGEAGGQGMRVSMVENRCSSVADAGDLEVIAPGRLLVGGVGVEVWEI